MGAFDVIVVGGGVIGAASAYYLSRKGQNVLLIDQYDVPNEWATSGDHAKMFRLTFGKDLFYTELAVKSLHLWKEFQKESREDLLAATGILDFALEEGGYEQASYDALKGMRLPVEKLGPDELREDYRILNPRAMRYALFHPDGGMLWAQRAVTAFATGAARQGAVLHKNARVAAVLRGKDGIREVRDGKGRSWRAAAYVFAAGPWTKEILSAFRLPLKVTRQQLLYFRPPQNQGRYRPDHCPVFSCHARGFYGFPVHIHGFMKIGNRRKGPAGRPGPAKQKPDPGFERSCRGFLKRFLPDLAGFAETELKVCHYNNTPDGDFILDRLPKCGNAFVATGFGRHGFKFAPVVGSLVADLVLKGKTELNLHRFRLDRFR